MGFSNLIDFLDSMLIATEADDITQQAQGDARKNMGGSSMETQDDRPEEDLMNTDDIFGENDKNNDGPSGNPQEDEKAGQNNEEMTPGDPTDSSEVSSDDPNEDGGVSEGGDEGGDDAGDPNLDDQPDDATTGENQSDELLFAKKNTVRDNLISLYEIIAGNVDTITETLSDIEDASVLKVTNAVLLHLRHCKDILYKTITVDITKLEYDELLRRYITIKRTYEICIKMLETEVNGKFDKNGKPIIKPTNA